MKITTVAAAVLSLAFLAACGKNDQRPASSGSSAAPQPQTSTTPATPPTSSTNSGKTERTPQQGQVDPKDSAQHKDFKTDGK